MFTIALSARTTGAACPESVAVVSAATVCTGAPTIAATAMPWYGIDGFGFPVNHKHLTRRPPSPSP